jgi:hypothetical protein
MNGVASQTGYFGGIANTANLTGGAFTAATGFNGGGFIDWYLPSISELSTMYAQAKLWDSSNGAGSFWTHCGGNNLINANYWSSSSPVTPPVTPSTINSIPALSWEINGDTGFISQATVVGVNARVRAIRAF